MHSCREQLVLAGSQAKREGGKALAGIATGHMCWGGAPQRTHPLTDPQPARPPNCPPHPTNLC